MPLELLDPVSAAAWDDRLVAAPGPENMFQTHELARTKERVGWEVLFTRAGETPIAIHTRRVAGLGAVWYLPKGPVVPDAAALTEALHQVLAAARRAGAFLVKVEPELPETAENLAALRELGGRPAAAIQPSTSTILLDLLDSEDALLKALNQKARYSIKRAGRDGVEAGPVPATDENVDLMYSLLAETAEGHGFGIRDRDYHAAFWRAFCEAGHGSLFVARHEGAPVAAAFATVIGEVSCYKDGASVRNRPAYGASHLLQWEIMRWAREHGATRHDLCGVPHSTRMDDETHPLHGIATFKSSFPKKDAVTDYVGAWDIPVRPVRSRLWDVAGYGVTRRVLARRGRSFY